MSGPDAPDEPPLSGPEKYLRMLEGTSLGEQLATPAGRRAALYGMFAKHPDPMWREMGEQLKSGQMKPTDILAVPAYRDHLLEGLRQAQEHQAEMFAALERAAEGGEPAAEPQAAGDAGGGAPAEAETETGIRTCPSCGRIVLGPDCVHCI